MSGEPDDAPFTDTEHHDFVDRGPKRPLIRDADDVSNAERFADQQENRLLHVYGIGWLYWSGGKRWQRDESGVVTRRAEKVKRAIYLEVAELNRRAAAEGDEAERDKLAARARKLAAWAQSSGSGRAIREITGQLGQARERLVLSDGAAGLDSDAHALNVQNGILDLRTFELRPHDPREYHTKITSAEYLPGAETDLWTTFIERVQPDEEQRRYVQKAAGLCLLGRFSEYFFVAWGSGSNGKSKFLGALRDTLGDYAADSPGDLFVRKFGGNSAGDSAAIARLRGRRLVTSVETAQGSKLDENLVKQVTGEDKLVAKFMRQNPFEFENQSSFWLATNHKPSIDSPDDAMKRRVRLIPWTVRIPESDKDVELGEKLRAPEQRAAILAWMVEGLRLYEAEGLDVPEAVETATSDWVDEMDPIKDWVESWCTLDADEFTPIAEVQASYAAYCKISNTKQVSAQVFNEALEGRGFIRKSPRIDGTKTRVWQGIAEVQTPSSIADLWQSYVDAGEPKPTEEQIAEYEWLSRSGSAA